MFALPNQTVTVRSTPRAAPPSMCVACRAISNQSRPALPAACCATPATCSPARTYQICCLNRWRPAQVLFEDRVVSIPCLPGKLGAEMFERQVSCAQRLVSLVASTPITTSTYQHVPCACKLLQVRHVFSLDPTVRLDVTFEVEAPALAPTLGELWATLANKSS